MGKWLLLFLQKKWRLRFLRKLMVLSVKGFQTVKHCHFGVGEEHLSTTKHL